MSANQPPMPPRSEDGKVRNMDHKDSPTDSHEISKIKQDEKGLAQKAGDNKEVSDIGWSQEPVEIEEQIVHGLSNEDLWMLIRRFDQQLYYVKANPDTPLQRLDLTRAEDEDFSPDKLRATLERFYTTVALGLISAVKHIARLRSWREQRRTSVFCTAYFVAWLLDFLAPTAFIMLIALVVYPPSRPWMFPPAPIAVVDTSTGGTKKPMAGQLGSDDSMTGASEEFKGEAAEKEASNLVASMASLAVGGVAGKHEQGTVEDDRSSEDKDMEERAPDPEEIVSKAADARNAVHGEGPADTHDSTRQPIKQTVLHTANQSMRVLSDITDTYERFGNALSPTPPFPWTTPYLRLGSVLAAALFVSLLTSSYAFAKLSTFFFGFGFFGEPILWRIVAFLDRRFTHWKQLLEVQNSLLRGIPTNAQLALTLLRIGEANVAPLPPPPNSQAKAPFSNQVSNDHHDTRSSDEVSHSPGDASTTTLEHSTKQTGFIPRVVSFFRGTTATGVVSKFAVDRVRAAAGSHHAKTRVGILRSKDKHHRSLHPSGPVEFDARYNGKRGAAVIDSSKDPPLLYFTTDPPLPAVNMENMGVEKRRKETVLFQLPVSDIREMRKTGGLGWKGKLVVGWAVGSKEVVDGLLVVGKDKKQRFQLTAMTTRNQLFDRLIAIDGQVWQ